MPHPAHQQQPTRTHRQPHQPLATARPAGRLPQQTLADVAGDEVALEQFVFEHGRLYDSYLATEPGREIFWSSGQQGLLSFTRRGRHVLVGGGLIAPPDERRRLLREFLDYLSPLNLRPMFFCIPDEDLPLFREVGFRISKLGEDALVDLPDCTFSGKEFEWVRRQVNYCLRQGVVASEAVPGEYDAHEWEGILSEVNVVIEDLLAQRPQSQELEFFDGRIGEHRLGRRRLFLARSDNGAGRLEGFVICNPMSGGRKWSLEIYRHRTNAVRGTMPFLFHHIMTQMRGEGVQAANLCIVPGRNCQTPLPDDNPFVRNGFARVEKYFSLLFDVSGIAHFKSRFRPRYESSYFCSPPDASFSAFWAILMTFGVLRLDARKTARLVFQRLRKRMSRKSLPKLG